MDAANDQDCIQCVLKQLQEKLPYLQRPEVRNGRLPTLEIIQQAINYISDLTFILQVDQKPAFNL